MKGVTRKITINQLDEVYSHVPASLIGHSIIALLLIYQLAGNTPDKLLVIWGISFFTIIAYRVGDYIAYNNQKAKKQHSINIQKRVLLLSTTVLAMGVSWGVTAIFIVHYNLIEYHFVPIAISMALSGIAVVTLGAIFIVYISFTLPMILIVSVTLLLEQSTTHISAGLAAIMALIFFVYTAFKHSKNVQKIENQNNEIQSTQLEILRRLSIASESRDTNTGQHINRMSHFSYLLALKSGLSKSEAKSILHASPMHDIGKISIPDKILLKPSRLNESEWEIMKTHTTAGKDILKGHYSNIMKTAANIAEYHHEKWDGTGYPNGLYGENIPICARIVTICDVFDALLSVRPYKEAWTTMQALDYMHDQAGKHFDPDLVNHFLDIAPQIAEHLNSYKH